MSTSAIRAALRRLAGPPSLPALGVLLVTACWLAALPGSAAASSNATTVSTCDEAGLRTAIAAAAPGDVVTFACGGTITLTAAEGGPIDLEKDLTIDGSGQAVTISGGGSVAVLEVAVGASVTLKGLTIADGAYEAGSAGENGAGGVLDRGALTVVDSTFTENSGNSTGLPTVAGAIYTAVLATLEITESTFSKNHASGTLSAGGIYSAGGHVAVTASTFEANVASQAGGIVANGGSLSVTNSTLAGNGAGPEPSGAAGALLVNGFASASVTNSTVTDNRYSCGNCSLDEGAGGIFIPLEGLGREPVALTNTIVAGNTYSQYATGSTVVDCGPASVTNEGGNFADDGSCEGAREVSAAELKLGPIADNGGPTRTVGLGPGSVAIDAASCLQATDQRGQPRPGAGGTKCDSGAYEAQEQTDTDLALTNVPNDIEVGTTSPSGATVTYTAPSAVDEEGDGSSPTVSCTPQSGTTFPEGTTTVTCTATSPDDTPSSVSASFSVVVKPVWIFSELSGSGTYGGTATLTARLTYGSYAFAGEPVLLALEGGKYIPAATDSNGVVTVSGVDLEGIDAGSHPAAVEAVAQGGEVVATGTLTVAPADQALTVTSPAPASAQNGSSFTVAATASSGLPVAYATAGSCTNSGATVTMTAGSGTCTVTYTQEGNGNYNAADPVSETVDVVALDTTPPAAEPVVTGTKGEDGWYRGDVSVAWHWTDGESGIDKSACTQSSTSSGEGAAVVVSSSCTDLAGNTAADKLTFKIDATKPTIAANGTAQAPTGHDGTRDWYSHDVAVGFSASDGISGPAEACASPWTVSTTGDGIGVTASSGPCADRAGNVNPGIASAAYNVDKTKPVVSVTGVADGATYTLGSVPAAGCETTDALSGVKAPATLSVSGGEVGTFTATCGGASDNAGNTNSTSVTYTVAYAFSGFLQPVDDQPICNVAKAGSAIPVVFSLGGDKGLDVIAAEYPKVKPGSCTGSTSSSIEETSTSGKSGLSYDSETDRYTYVWKTDKAWRGQARRLVVVLADGTRHTAEFAFTK